MVLVLAGRVLVLAEDIIPLFGGKKVDGPRAGQAKNQMGVFFCDAVQV